MEENIEKKSNIKWKKIYKDNLDRKICEIKKIKNYDVELDSNSITFLKQRKYIISVFFIVVLIALVITFWSEPKVLSMVVGFVVFALICFFIFNSFKLKCTPEGLYLKFGIQSGTFPYDRIKSVYLSKFSDYSLILPIKNYSIVVRYIDNFSKIKELSFPTYFLNKEDTINFLDNFEIEETPQEQYIYFERKKSLKKILKYAGVIAIIVTIIIFAISAQK